MLQGVKFWRRSADDTVKLRLYVAILVFFAFFQTALETYKAVKIGEVIGAAAAYADPLKASTWAFPLWVYGSLVLALSNTSILSVSLWKTKTGLSYLDKTLKHIIGLTWETAALPCLCMVVAAGLYSSRQMTKVRHLDLFFIIASGKFYTLGILRTLNSRLVLRERLTSTDLGGRRSLSDYEWNQASGASSAASDKPLAPNRSLGRPSATSETSEAHSSRLVSLATGLEETSGDTDISPRDHRADDRTL
ncbi:hypothetical protein AcV5_001314 [Taiwanofungus camphoratus]|nr:hypothetical protein AcV5_001314 [Antrodia cinnamomea]